MAVDRKPESNSPLRVGIAGLGTVGAGVIELLPGLNLEHAIDDLHETVRLVQTDTPTDDLATDRPPQDLRL